MTAVGLRDVRSRTSAGVGQAGLEMLDETPDLGEAASHRRGVLVDRVDHRVETAAVVPFDVSVTDGHGRPAHAGLRFDRKPAAAPRPWAGRPIWSRSAAERN